MDTTNPRPQALHYLAGPIFLACAALIYNVIARSFRRPSISAGVRWVVNQNTGAEVAGGIIGVLLAHWLINDGKSNK